MGSNPSFLLFSEKIHPTGWLCFSLHILQPSWVLWSPDNFLSWGDEKENLFYKKAYLKQFFLGRVFFFFLSFSSLFFFFLASLIFCNVQFIWELTMLHIWQRSYISFDLFLTVMLVICISELFILCSSILLVALIVINYRLLYMSNNLVFVLYMTTFVESLSFPILSSCWCLCFRVLLVST